jgi:hypothetical protein
MPFSVLMQSNPANTFFGDRRDGTVTEGGLDFNLVTSISIASMVERSAESNREPLDRLESREIRKIKDLASKLCGGKSLGSHAGLPLTQ